MKDISQFAVRLLANCLMIASVVESVSVHKYATETEYCEPTRECKSGYVRAGDVCRRIETRPAQKSCKRGWKLIDGMCSQRLVTVLPGKCPPESFWDGKRCIMHEVCDFVETCPPDSQLVDGMCQLLIRTTPAFRCPKGFKPSGDGSCFAETKFKGQYSCPDGFFPGKHGCARIMDVEPQLICSHGYDLVDGVCVKEHSYDMIIKCKHGYLYDDKLDKCFRKIQREAEPSCNAQSEYDPRSRTCIRTTRNKPRPECCDGFELDSNNMCRKVVYEEPSLFCDEGQILENGSCMSIIFEEPLFSCQDGHKFEDGYCTFLEYLDHTSCCKHGFERIDRKCVKRSSEQPTSGCEKGFTLCDNICRKVISAPKERTCVDGELRGKKCIAYVTINAEPYCKVGRLDHNECVISEESCPIKQCPPGYERLKSGACAKESTCDATFECPLGTSLIGHNKCESVVAEKPDLSCPKHYSLLEGRCQRVFEMLPELTCANGYKMRDGKCVLHKKVPKECHYDRCD